MYVCMHGYVFLYVSVCLHTNNFLSFFTVLVMQTIINPSTAIHALKPRTFTEKVTKLCILNVVCFNIILLYVFDVVCFNMSFLWYVLKSILQ